MKRLLFIALTLLMWAAPASASQYKGYYYGADTPQRIAELVERSLARDATGRTMLDAAKCRRDGSCAAPINYLESFQAHDPQAGLTQVTQLPDYLRRLEIDCTVSGAYQMDRIILASGSLGRTDVNGMSRSFHQGECAWVNPETRRPVLAQDCANPVGQRVGLRCVYVNFEVKSPNEFAVIWARYNREDDPCSAYRRTARLYEPDLPNTVWHDLPRGCIGVPCDLTAVNQAVGRANVAQGQIPLGQPGTYQIRISPEELLVLCVKYRGARGVTSSFASGVRWRQDYQLIERRWHARVFHTSDELRTAGLTFNEPRGLVFWAANSQDEAEMHRLAGMR